MNILPLAGRWVRTCTAAVAAAGLALLSACGYEDPPPPEPGPAADIAGVYTGTDNTNAPVSLLLLDSGRYYLLYGALAPNPVNAPGFLYGDGRINGNSFLSSDMRDFSVNNGALGTLAATFVARDTFDGTATYANNTTRTFTLTYQPAFDAVPSLNAMRGNYTGRLQSAGATDSITHTQSNFGNFDQTTGTGCTARGALQSGLVENSLFNMLVTFGNGCGAPGQTQVGHALLAEQLNTVFIVGTDAAETSGFSIVVTRN